MPSERFLRLPKEKQMVIWNAALEEFTNEPFEKASINKIIQNAGISRGSFYTYFVDKRDLFQYILQVMKEQWMEFCIQHLKENGADLWEMMRELMKRAVTFCKENNLVQLHQNMMMYPGASFLDGPNQDEVQQDRYRLYEHSDRTEFREDSFEYFSEVLEECFIAAVITIARLYKTSDGLNRIVETFEKKLEIIQYGACMAPEKGNGGIR